MVALTMIISINSLAYSFETDMGNWIENALGGDLYIRAAQPMRESFASQLRNVPGVQQVTPARTLVVSAAPGSLQSNNLQSQGVEVNDKFYFEAIEPETYRLIGDMEFVAGQGDPEANWARLEQGKALFISNVVADRYDLHQGDELVLLTRRGEQAFLIAAEVVSFGGQGQVIYGTYDDLHRWFAERDANRFTIRVVPGYSIDTVAQEIESRYQGSQQISVQSTDVFKKDVTSLMNQSFRLFDVLSLIGVIIGALGVINTLTMNVIERQREIGGLRSLGMTRVQVIRMVLAEAFSLGVMGGIYGLGAGYVIGHVLIVGVNKLVGYDLEYVFTADPFLISVVIALVVVQIAAVFPARRAASVNIIEAIKHE
jgi:putative ABC transport system permease protein